MVHLFDPEDDTASDTAESDPAESPLFAELNPVQREAVATTEGPVLVVAGAGSGKTRVLTYRIAHLIRDLGVSPSAILAITFTNKAANEMKERVARLVGGAVKTMWVSTFHSACVRILRREAPRLGYRSSFTIYDAQDSLRAITLAVKDLNLDVKRFPPRSIRATISNAKNELIDYESFQAQGAGFYHENVADVYRLYQQRMLEASAMDFDDLLMVTCELFAAFPDVLEHYQERFRYIHVDEYQDTNRAQYTLVNQLAAMHRNVCVVGDGDQCLPGEAAISTPSGRRPIAELAEGDEVLAVSGHGTLEVGTVRAVRQRAHGERLFTVGTSTATLRGTSGHVVPARLDDLDATHVVYLMYRADKGYRLGITRSFRVNNRGARDIGLRVRANQEHADKAWIVRACPSEAEARYWEAFYAAAYGLPTTCFHASGREGLAFDQAWIDRLYEELDTVGAAKWLFADLDLSFDHPHHRPQNGARRQTINLTMFSDRRSHGAAYHRLQLSSNRDDLAAKLREAGVPLRPGKLPGTWRFETSRASYEEAVRLARDVADAGGLEIRHRMAVDGVMYDHVPLAHLHPGMTVLVEKNGLVEKDGLVEDGGLVGGHGQVRPERVTRVDAEEWSGEVYDIDVHPQHVYVADGVAVHNSIYKFRGADIRNILDFEQDYPDARVIVLDQNYRSTETILHAANSVISNNGQRKPKRLWTDLGRGVPIVRYEAEDEHDEAAFIADEIASLEEAEGIVPSDVAIFYRTNAQSRVVEEVLVRYGVPYNVVGSVKFYERREIKDVLAYLRVLVNPDDPISVKRVVNVPKRGIGDTSIGHIDRFAEAQGISFFDALRRIDEIGAVSKRAANAVRDFLSVVDLLIEKAAGGPMAAVNAVLTETGYLADVEAEKTIESMGRSENLRELLSGAEEFERSSEGTIVDGEEWDDMGGLRRLELFLETVSLVADTDDLEDGSRAATLMTLHNAKGLEYPVVFIVGMEDGVFPHMRSLGDPDELEEERRLCYVGLTRAEQRLYLTSAWSRLLFGATSYNPPSRFIKEIPEDLVEKAGKRKRDPKKESIGGPRPTVSGSEIAVGDRVRHDTWGVGVVSQVIGEGDRAEAEVDFEEGSKRLLLAWAPLTKV